MTNLTGIKKAVGLLDNRIDGYISTLKKLKNNENPNDGVQAISKGEVETVENLIIKAAKMLTNSEPEKELWIRSHEYCSLNETKFEGWTEQNLEYFRWLKFWIQKSYTYLEFLEGFNEEKITFSITNDVKEISKIQIKDVFICHASEDKKTHIEPLLNELNLKSISYWYDNAEIKWGDSIVKKVNEGLKNSKFVIVVLSINSIRKRWPNNELEAALNIEFSSGQIKVLPLLIGTEIEVKHILDNYPILSSKLYLSYSSGLDFIVNSLLERIK